MIGETSRRTAASVAAADEPFAERASTVGWAALAQPAAGLSWSSQANLTAGEGPYDAPCDRLGPARGLMLGLAIGAVFWVLIGVTIWRVLL